MKAGKRIAGIAMAMTMACSTLTTLPTAYAAEAAVSEAYVTASEATATSNILDDVVASSGYKTKYTTRYAYKKLSSNEKKLYQKIYTAAMNLNPTVSIPSGLSENQIMKVYSLVFHQEPQLFWLGTAYKVGYNGKYLYVNYQVIDTEEIEKMQKKINKTVKSVMTKVKKQKTTYSKLKIIYDQIVLTNDFVQDNSGYNGTIYNAFVKGEDLQCAGYAKAVQYLCDLAGIKSMVVQGTNEKGDSHAWNIVYCANGYYNLDATWGDLINDFGEDYIQYEYFLVPDKWIHNYTHFNVNKVTRSNGETVKLFTPPSCTKTTYNYFVKNKKNYSSASAAYSALKSQIKTAVKNGKNVVEVRVTSEKLYKSLTGSTYASKISKYAKSLSKNVEKVGVHKTYTKGSYIVHYDITYKK